MNIRRFDAGRSGTALAIYSTHDAAAVTPLLDELSQDGYEIARAEVGDLESAQCAHALSESLEHQLEHCSAVVIFLACYDGAAQDYTALASLLAERAAERERACALVVLESADVPIDRKKMLRLRETLRLCKRANPRPAKPSAEQAFAQQLSGLSDSERSAGQDIRTGGRADENEPLPDHDPVEEFD